GRHLRQADDTMLGTVICRFPGKTDDAVDGSHVEDRPAALLFHDRHHMLRSDERRHKHDIDHLPEFIRRELLYIRHMLQPCVIEQHIDAPILLFRPVNQILYIILTGHVSADAQTVVRLCLQIFDDFIQLLLIDVGQYHFCAILQKYFADLEPESARSTCNDRHFILHHAYLPSYRATSNSASVFSLTSSTVAPSCSSTSFMAPSSKSNTARSVMRRSTTRSPVRGSSHSFLIFASPCLLTWSMMTTTFLAPATRSMAPPMPFTSTPGII